MKQPARGGYVYPFGSGTTVGRIDQGQDFGGSGSVRAIGRAKVIATHSPWPEYSGGAGIVYELLEGKYKGRHIYVYEGVQLASGLKVGQKLSAGQTIAAIIPGTSSGIESGWAGPGGQPISRSEYTEGKETKAGKSFAAFLTAIKSGKQPAGGSGNNGFSSFGPLGTAEEIIAAPIDAGAAAVEGAIPSTEDILGGLFGDLAKSAEPLMLNIGLLGGGAFLVYYGAALLLGVKQPVATPLKGAVR